MKKLCNIFIVCSLLFLVVQFTISNAVPVGKGGGAEKSSSCRCEKPVMLCNGRYAPSYVCDSCINAEATQTRVRVLQEQLRRKISDQK